MNLSKRHPNPHPLHTPYWIWILALLIPILGFLSIWKTLSSSNFPTIARVIDGDTIELDNGEVLRFKNIDAPEKNTECGMKALLTVLTSLRNEPLVIERFGKDRYGRTLATVKYGRYEKYDIEEELVNLRLAVYYHGTKANPNICL